jgi:hypothetical protein
MLAWAGELDGEIVALGGLAFSKGRWFAFCDLKPEARQFKMTIMRVAKRVLEDARERNIRFIYAEADPDEPKAVRWMQSLGFKPDERSGILYRWRQ